MNGWLIDMDDKILVSYDGSTDLGLFGVFDGHGDGGHASDYVASTFMIRIVVNVGSARSRVMHASLR